MFIFNIESSKLEQRLQIMNDRSTNIPVDVFRKIGEYLIGSIVQNFNSGGRPPWIPSRSAQEEGRKTLIKSGALRDSGKITSLSSTGVEVAQGVGLGKYPIFMQLGTSIRSVTDKQRGFFWWKYKSESLPMWKALALSKIIKGLPPRPFVLFQEEDKTKILEYLNNYFIGEPISDIG